MSGEKHGAEKHGGGSHKKPKKHEEGLKVDAPMWMMSWADMVTLLMALFVAMYSMSTLDIMKFQKFMKGIKGEFSREEGMSAAEAMEKGLNHMVGSEPEVPRGEGKHLGSTDVQPMEPDIYGRSSRWRDGLPAPALRLHFAPGSADLDAGHLELLRGYALALRGYESRIEIRGHCSAGESEASRNLSFARAMEVYDYLADPRRGRISEDRLKVTAMGTADPLTKDQSPFEKAGNRLVEIMEAPEYPGKTSGR